MLQIFNNFASYKNYRKINTKQIFTLIRMIRVVKIVRSILNINIWKTAVIIEFVSLRTIRHNESNELDSIHVSWWSLPSLLIKWHNSSRYTCDSFTVAGNFQRYCTILHNSPLVRIAIIIPHKPNVRAFARSKASFLSFKFIGIARLARYSRSNEPWRWRRIGWSFGECLRRTIANSRSQLIESCREWSTLSSCFKSAPAAAFIFRWETIVSRRTSSPLRSPFQVDKEPLYSRHTITMRSNIAPVKIYPHQSLHDIINACGKYFSNSLSLGPQRVDQRTRKVFVK